MSIASEIQRLQGVKSDILEAIAEKGVTVPAGSALADCPTLIGNISGGGGGGLPVDYTEVEYIGNSSKGVISIALPEETSDYVYVYMKFEYTATESSDNSYLLGILDSFEGQFLRVGVGTASGKMSIMLYNANSHTYVVNIQTSQHINVFVTLLNNCGQFLCDDISSSHGEFGQYYGAARDKAKYICVFGAYVNGHWLLGDSFCSHQKLKRLKLFGIYTGAVLADFIPCKNTQNTPGLYDVVSGTFYSGSVNASHIYAGPEVQ